MHSLAARHPKGADDGMFQCMLRLPDKLEVLGVLVVRAREAPFDEVEAQFIQLAGDEQFVLEGEVDALPLAAVAKRGVVELGHRVSAKW